jgi:hypothetical protein
MNAFHSKRACGFSAPSIPRTGLVKTAAVARAKVRFPRFSEIPRNSVTLSRIYSGKFREIFLLKDGTYRGPNCGIGRYFYYSIGLANCLTNLVSDYMYAELSIFDF